MIVLPNLNTHCYLTYLSYFISHCNVISYDVSFVCPVEYVLCSLLWTNCVGIWKPRFWYFVVTSLYVRIQWGIMLVCLYFGSNSVLLYVLLVSIIELLVVRLQSFFYSFFMCVYYVVLHDRALNYSYLIYIFYIHLYM